MISFFIYLCYNYKGDYYEKGKIFNTKNNRDGL